MDLVALAPDGFERPLVEECGERVIEQRERLVLLNGKAAPVWAQNLWLEPKTFNFKSISDAVKHLRSLQRNWWLHSVGHHRRASLIQEGLPPLKPKPIAFLTKAPEAPMGAFTLLDENTLLYSARTSSPYADGEVNFVENKVDPPSRAYLKLWELFTVERFYPRAGEKVLDLGSSPGGWTWVLDQLGSEVVSVDKAPLAENLKLSSNVKFIEESAFGLDPARIGRVDWLFSDVICYPERLLELVLKWLESGQVRNLVCTLKFQGPTDHATVAEFAKLPGARLRHLFHNKHELTWTCQTGDRE